VGGEVEGVPCEGVVVNVIEDRVVDAPMGSGRGSAV
jgi:hypothetical protein